MLAKKVRTLLPWLLLTLLLGLALHWAGRVWLQQPGSVAPQALQRLYELKLKDQDGQAFDMASLKGKLVVLNFWATWCEPCREEMPEFSTLAKQYANQNVVFVGLAIDEASAVKDFAQQTSIAYPLLIAENEGMILAEQFGNNKGVLPFTVVLGVDGDLKKTFFGRVNRAMLEPIISTNISQPHSTAGKK
jgi:thiol-disulfide isomerase/thioredoxin